jgi:hypothetical protein
MKNFCLGVLVLFSIIIQAQTTVGVLTMTEEVSEGYTFFSPFSSTSAYMVDNCGNLINEWDRGTRPGLSAYFLDNGLMMRTYKISPIGPYTSASNAGGIELVNWDNEVVWNFEINNSTQLSHHDAVMMPNGNILILVWELTFRDELIEIGRDPNEIAVEGFMWSEKIFELQPVGTDDAEIVWEWHINDHLIQDFDSTQLNFGVVSDHPELFDINQPDLNSGNSNATRDYFHFNAIDFNPALDQILISIRNSDEILIIDHSTTTEEAAGHTGGRYGRGGDLLYRWGNPSAYKIAPLDDQMLFGQHGVNWVQEGLDDEGSILIFNNGNGKPGPDCTQIQLLTPPQSSPGFYERNADMPFGPDRAVTIFGDAPGETFYSAFLSNAFRLDNGNTLINSGSPGRIFEITPEREIAWAYEIPLSGNTPIPQGINANNNGNFRAYKYALDFPGFDGIDIVAGAPIEVNPVDCQLLTSTDDIDLDSFEVRYISQSNTIIVNSEGNDITQVLLKDLQGRTVEQIDYTDAEIRLHSLHPTGIYIATLVLEEGEAVSLKIYID